MAIRGGPDIIEDGLVLHLDAAEPLCFRGEPTTNLMPYTNGVAGRVGWPGGAYTHSIETTGEFAGWEKIVATTTGSIANTVMRVGDVSCAANTQYTATMEFYSPYNNLKFNVSGSYGNYNGIRIGNSNRYYVTFTKNSTTGNQGWWLLTTASTPANTAISNGVIYYRRAQFEQKPYYTDFTIGTRGSTVATGGGLLDLTNNGNDGTINRSASPTAVFYNSNNGGSFVFDGNNDRIDCGDIIKGRTTFSASAWMKSSDNRTGSNSTYMNPSIFGTQHGSGLSGDFALTVKAGKLGFYAELPNSVYRDSNVTVCDNIWHYVVVTKTTAGIIKLYVDGQEVYSSSGYSSALRTSDLQYYNWELGRAYWYGEDGSMLRYIGLIAMHSLYDHELLPSEILQNYNATKGRFGL